jgi:hypothetical protein
VRSLSRPAGRGVSGWNGRKGGRKRGGTDCADYVDNCCECVPYYSRDFIGAGALTKDQ